MHYTWDEGKNRRNLELHGIALEDAARIFEGPTVERVDDRFDYGEERIITLGLSEELVLYVVSTERDADCVRIIPVRRAENDEIERYDLSRT